MLTNILHRWNDVMALRRGDKVWPSFADFHTSNACNQHCAGCAYDGTLDQRIMSEADHFNVVDQLHSVGVRAYDFAGGGEPTMLPYLPKLLRHIRGLGDYFAVFTNGLILGDDLADAMISGGTYVRFSLEASSREDYAVYKRVDARQWQIVTTNAARLVAAASEKSSPLEVSVKFAVGKSLRGTEHYRRCIMVGRTLGARRITIKALRHEPEELPEMERAKEGELLRKVIFEENAEDIVSAWVAPLKSVPHCWLTPMHTVIDHLGDAYLCCYYYNGRQDEMYLGNVLREPFKNIWLDGRHRALLQNIRHERCLQQDCKFMKHGLAVAEAFNRGHVEWL